MKFHGLKKVTLIDFPDTIACTVFTHGCLLRCPFCHNPELVIEPPEKSESITDAELLEFLGRRINKLDGVVFTGGEPLLHKDALIPVLEKIRNLGLKIKMDTNGTFEVALAELIQKELVDYIAMDFKTSYEEYPKMGANETHIASIKKSLETILSSEIPYEVRTTVVPGLHTPETIRAMGPIIKKFDTYILQNFVPNGTIDPAFKTVKSFSPEEMQKLLDAALPFNSNAEIRGQ